MLTNKFNMLKIHIPAKKLLNQQVPYQYVFSFCSCDCTLLEERGTFYLLFLKEYSRENQN